MDWWWQNRNTILGTTGSTLWTKGEYIFFGDRRLVLTDTTNRLLSCLVDGPEGFASKDELKQAGWPEASSQGVSDPALREAVRRMKNELKTEFKRNNLGDPPTINSIRGQGYRLENVEPNGMGGDNGDE